MRIYLQRLEFKLLISSYILSKLYLYYIRMIENLDEDILNGTIINEEIEPIKRRRRPRKLEN